MKLSRLVPMALVFATSLIMGPAQAENKNWPTAPSVTDLSNKATWPDDPGYPGAWELFSFIPKAARASVSKAELAMGSGCNADRAWQKTTGDARVLVAVLDSGIRWKEYDLVNKFYLNRGELPKPDKACQTANYSSSRPWDANGDGVFNVQDYTTNTGHQSPKTPCDPKVKNFAGGWDTNKNGLLDPQDLIQIFSDGKDTDHNGFIDDISGWDVYDNDNDPNDDTSYGHGTGEAKDSCAEGNNKIGGIGICPRCTVMPVRLGDSFMTEANDFAMAVIFAVDSGATVIQEATGAISNSAFAMDAIDYAYDNNVVIIGSAADENSFHANFPAANQHSTYVHAIVYDGTSVSTSTTFLNFNNCTNYGPRLELSTPGTGCSSEATGKTSGIAGLLYSAALKAGLDYPGGKATATDKFGSRRLSAEEAKQLLTMTVDDINVPGSATDKTKYPSKAGWEQRFGWGRTNARTAVDAVLAKKIPPEVDILTPQWFEVLYPKRKGVAEIKVRLAFRTKLFKTMDYVLEYAGGADPAASAWKTITSEKGLTTGKTLIYKWDISKLVINNPDMPPPDRGVNKRMVTLRVRATVKDAAGNTVKGEARKAFHIQRDPDLLPGFPVNLVSSGEASPKVVDLNGDGKWEIIVATSDGRVHAIEGNGKELNGWPVKVNYLHTLKPKDPQNHRKSAAFTSGTVSPDYRSNISSAPAIGDLDGDGKLEVVIASYDGDVYAFGPDGTVRTGFPVSIPTLDKDKVTDRYNVIDDGIFAAPVLVDLDNDKKLEIVVAAMDGKIYVWRYDGTKQAGFPVQLQDPRGNSNGHKLKGRIVASPAVGDIDGDKVPDIVVGSNENLNNFGPLYVVHGQGSGNAIMKGWPARVLSLPVLPMVGEGLPNAPALADVNGDGLPEIAVGGLGTVAQLYSGMGEKKIPLCFDKAGINPDPKRTDWVKHVIPCKGKNLRKRCAELEASDKTIVCVGGAMENNQFGKNSDTTDRPSVVLITNGTFGDLDNDKIPDLIYPMGGFGAAKAFAAGGKRSDFDHQLGAWNSVTRKYFDAYPRRVDDWQFFMNPAVADISGDDYPEVLVGTAGYWIHAFDKNGKEPSGWPKLTGQWNIPSPAVGDITGDGKLEVVANTRSGWLYAWKTAGSSKGRIDWESFGHDSRNTRNLATKLKQGITSAELKPRQDGGVGPLDGGGTVKARAPASRGTAAAPARWAASRGCPRAARWGSCWPWGPCSGCGGGGHSGPMGGLHGGSSAHLMTLAP